MASAPGGGGGGGGGGDGGGAIYGIPPDTLPQPPYHKDQADDRLLNAPTPPFNAPHSPGSPAESIHGRDRERVGKERGPTDQSRSRTRNGRHGSAQARVCKACGESLTGQFVRAIGATFHLECFTCRVSIVTSDLVVV